MAQSLDEKSIALLPTSRADLRGEAEPYMLDILSVSLHQAIHYSTSIE